MNSEVDNPTFRAVTFEELSVIELYKILQLRSEIFVVEQECVYQDMDDKDQHALHVMMYHTGQIAGHTRIIPIGISYPKHASIGRVVVAHAFRGGGWGKVLMQYSIEVLFDHFGRIPVRISAQTYLNRFYNEMGFVATGKAYLEDGIPHIEMDYNGDEG